MAPVPAKNRQQRRAEASTQRTAKPTALPDAAQAENHLLQVLTVTPGDDKASWALTGFYIQQKRFAEAEQVCRVAMAANPKQAKYPLQLVQFLELRGMRNEMEPLLTAAIAAARASNDLQALVRSLVLLGGILFHRGDRIKALPYFHEAVVRGGDHAVQSMFCQCIGKIRFGAAHPDLKPVLTRAFREVWIRPADIMRVSANLLFHEPAFKEAVTFLNEHKNNATWLGTESIRTIANEPLLLALMEATMVMDAVLELILVGCRKALLAAHRADADLSNFVPFITALAHQGFANEYAFFATAEEEADVAALMEEIAAAIDHGTTPDALDVMLLAAYRPLHTTPFAEALLAYPWNTPFDGVITRQLREPREEEALRATIPCITPITDAVSEAVRNQYEENPYPRWVEAPRKEGPFALSTWVRTYFPGAPLPAKEPDHALEVLVAGCGTGQQSVNSAGRFYKSNVLAVDLSLASLGYAVRKTNEFGITNVTYAQADLLELGALSRQFDMVECGGVLHHLSDPLKGWRVLTDLTKPGGYMSIALYSEFARKYLEPVRAYAKAQGFGTTADELRRFRASIFTLPADHPAAMVALRRDFYSLSMLRDLVFHVQEHRFTIPQLAAALTELGLMFGGFNLPPESKRGFRTMFGDKADTLSLEQWATFEEAEPETFIGMYQFLVMKPAG